MTSAVKGSLCIADNLRTRGEESLQMLKSKVFVAKNFIYIYIFFFSKVKVFLHGKGIEALQTFCGQDAKGSIYCGCLFVQLLRLLITLCNCFLKHIKTENIFSYLY